MPINLVYKWPSQQVDHLKEVFKFIWLTRFKLCAYCCILLTHTHTVSEAPFHKCFSLIATFHPYVLTFVLLLAFSSVFHCYHCLYISAVEKIVCVHEFFIHCNISILFLRQTHHLFVSNFTAVPVADSMLLPSDSDSDNR